MKKHFLFVAALAATMMAQATVVVDETFTDFPTAWTASGSVTTGVGRTQDAALTYTADGKTFALSGQGNAVKTALDASSSFQHTKSLPNAVTDCYVSFLLRADGQQKQSQTQVFGLGSPSLAMRVWLGKGQNDATKCRLGVTRSSGTGGDVQWGATEFATDQTMLIVLKYTMTATDTVASIYVNPAIGGTEPATPFASDNTKGANKCKKSLSNMTFYTTGNTKSYFTVGGARVCTTWAEAVEAGSEGPAPEPEALDSVATKFKTEDWGTLLTKDSEGKYPIVSGSYPDTIINGFELNSAVMADGSIKRTGETTTAYTNRVMIDKNGSFVTPLLSNVSTVDLAFNTGSDSKTLTLQYLDNNKQWVDVETITGMKALAENTYTINVNHETKIRVLNGSGSTLYVWAITTHPYGGHTPTGFDQVAETKAVKTIENGQIVIIKNGVRYNAMGAKL